MRPTTVRQDELAPQLELYGQSAFIGMCLFVLLWIVSLVTLSLGSPTHSTSTLLLSSALSIAVNLAIATRILVACRRTIATTRRALTSGLGVGTGTGTALVGVGILGTWNIGAVPVLAFATFLFAGSVFLTIVGWLAINLILGPVRLIDGKSCVACGYCLLGCESMKCPECGRAFTYEELGTTEAEFKARQNFE